MKRPFSVIITIFALVLPAFGQAGKKNPVAGAKPAAKPKVTTEHKDKKIVSYLIGADIGSNMKSGGLDIDIDRFMAGFKAALGGELLEYSDEDKNRILRAFSQDRQTIARKNAQIKAHGLETIEQWDALAAKNKAAGEKFLAENAKKEGVKTTASGLQYKVITMGEGDIPKLTDRVKAKYRGTLIDGKMFDESRGGVPTPFSLRGVIKGWTEALQMMPVGSKWQLFIPSELAYGDLGRRPPIGPNTTLIFDIELAEVTKPVPQVSPPVRAPRPGTSKQTGSTTTKRKPITATTPPVAVEFPKEKGGKIKVTPVDPKTGKPIGKTKLIEPKAQAKPEQKK
ncbi:MAG: FKBP-type peptidyl-prolyl cis-trans isomerase [Verrucomicrobiales bacterium]|nr:FKBP-type peptidyl-prolyl cis-trans isomerase [Verrucomicrobiales bacterium]